MSYMNGIHINYGNRKFKSLELYEEQYNGEMYHFLKGVLEYKTVTRKYDLTIPKIDLCNSFYKVPEITCNSVCDDSNSIFQLYHIWNLKMRCYKGGEQCLD